MGLVDGLSGANSQGQINLKRYINLFLEWHAADVQNNSEKAKNGKFSRGNDLFVCFQLSVFPETENLRGSSKIIIVFCCAGAL